MAYVPIDEEEEKKQQEAGQQGPEKVLSGESSELSPTAPQGGGTGGAANPKPTNSGRGWTNLTSYVQANQGADTRMGEGVKNEYQKTHDAATTATGTYGADATKAVTEGTRTDNGTVASLKNVGVQKPPPTTKNSGPSYFPTPEPVSAEKFAQNIEGYQGPEDAAMVNGFTGAEDAVLDAKDTAQRADDFEGRRTILSDLYGGDGRYSAGEQRLDSFLVGGGAGGQAALGSIRDQSAGLGKGWEELVNKIGGDIDTARKTSTKTKDDTLAALEAAKGHLGDTFADLDKQVTASNTKADATFQAIVAGLSSNDPKARHDAAAKLGIDPAEIENMVALGVDPAAIVSAVGPRGLGDLVTDQQLSDWDMLGQLSGLAGTDPLPEFDFTKTGSSGGAWTLDSDRLGKAKEASKAEADLKARLAEAQKAREDEYTLLKRGIRSKDPKVREEALSKIGLTDAQLQLAADNGLNVFDFFSLGPKLTVGDIANDNDRKSWGDLMSYLGGKGGLDLSDTQDEGAAYTFDTKAFLKALKPFDIPKSNTLPFADSYTMPGGSKPASSGGGGGGSSDPNGWYPGARIPGLPDADFPDHAPSLGVPEVRNPVSGVAKKRGWY